MNDGFKLTLTWIAASVAALLVALAPAYAALVNGHYIPVGNDSFYHARRILDMIADPSSLHEFDRLIHVPEGSLLVWPWGYDYFMSLIARAGLALGLSDDPIAILDHVPVLAFLGALVLMLVIARKLGASVPATAMALFATALFPLNQGLYAVGNIDHHFAEHLFVLGSLAAAIAWQRQPNCARLACLTGIVLGIAPAIHNGLFILQLPLVAAFAWAWMRNTPLPRNSLAFGIALLASTLAVALPSTALREGQFEFYILSWFHVYISLCTAIVTTALSRLAFTLRNLAMFAGGAVLLLIPIAGQALLGERFLNASVEGMAEIAETKSYWALSQHGQHLRPVAEYGTWLVFVVPLTAALCAWRLWRDRDLHRSFFWIACLVGLALLSTQLRLHYFGSFALYLPWILLVDEHARRAPARAALVLTALAAVLGLSYAQGVRFELLVRKITGNDPYYALTADLYPKFADQCARAPGVALSSLDDANYIRYHTKCAVIANNFLLTPLHERKVLEVRSLLALPAAALHERVPDVRYVYVRRAALFRRNEQGGLDFISGGDPNQPDMPLVAELLSAPAGQLPPGYRLLEELAFEKPVRTPYARLFALDPVAPGRVSLKPGTPMQLQ